MDIRWSSAKYFVSGIKRVTKKEKTRLMRVAEEQNPDLSLMPDNVELETATALPGSALSLTRNIWKNTILALAITAYLTFQNRL